MSREENVYLATLAQETERYDDLVAFMKEVVVAKKGLNRDEATLFSLGYKQKISSCRNAWRTISIIEPKPLEGGCVSSDALARYRRNVELEMEKICDEVIELVDQGILPHADGAESKAFFIKMKADYLRYLAEFAQGENFNRVVQDALEAYEEASKIAQEGLPEGHPVSLGIALNFSVFHFEALGDHAKACELARAAIDTPEACISALSEEQANDSQSMLKLLQDNIELWTNQGDADDDEAPGDDEEHEDDEAQDAK